MSRTILCYVHPEVLANKLRPHQPPPGEIAFFTAMEEYYPDVEVEIRPWPEGNVKALMRMLTGSRPALIRPAYSVDTKDLNALVRFCQQEGHVPFIFGQLMTSADGRETDPILWRRIRTAVRLANRRPAEPVSADEPAAFVLA